MTYYLNTLLIRKQCVFTTRDNQSVECQDIIICIFYVSVFMPQTTKLKKEVCLSMIDYSMCYSNNMILYLVSYFVVSLFLSLSHDIFPITDYLIYKRESQGLNLYQR